MRGMGAPPGFVGETLEGQLDEGVAGQEETVQLARGQTDEDVHGDPPADLLAADIDLHQPILGPRFAPFQARPAILA